MYAQENTGNISLVFPPYNYNYLIIIILGMYNLMCMNVYGICASNSIESLYTCTAWRKVIHSEYIPTGCMLYMRTLTIVVMQIERRCINFIIFCKYFCKSCYAISKQKSSYYIR